MTSAFEEKATLEEFKKSVEMLLESRDNKIESLQNKIEGLKDEREVWRRVLRQIAVLTIEMEDYAREQKEDSEKLGNMIVRQSSPQRAKSDAFTDMSQELRRILQPVRDI